MNRIHAFEFEDLRWVPKVLRDGGTDLLDTLFARMRFYRAFAPDLVATIDATGITTLGDLCSGGGGGALAMLTELEAAGRRDIALVLSDRYPNQAAIDRVRAWHERRHVRYLANAVDALDAPAQVGQIRTMFGATHHFRPGDVRAILQRAVEAGVPVALFDVAASPAVRKIPLPLAPIAACLNMAALFVLSLALVPLARPFRWSRVLWTYGVPLIPVLFAWDGTMSALRAYTPDELLAIARSVDGADGYAWASQARGSALMLTGRPSH